MYLNIINIEHNSAVLVSQITKVHNNSMKIYHNPRCRKSRETLALIEEKGKKADIILYLDTPPNKDEIIDILKKLKLKPEQLIRKTEKVYKEKYKGLTMSDDEWIEAMIDHPKLIERPIVIKGTKAIVGRPPENVLSLL